jgi:hypothetical protein
MSMRRDPGANAAADARKAIEDAQRPLSSAAELLRGLTGGALAVNVDEHRRTLDRLIDGDPAGAGRSRASILEIERERETAARNLARPDLRDEERTHWSLELRSAAAAIDQRRRALLELTGAVEQRRKVLRAQAVRPPAPVETLSGKDVNNTWYLYRPDSAYVIVFVHGILSDGRTCWLNEVAKPKPVFWPELLAGDDRFEDPSIFLGGYYTAFDSGVYDIRDAAIELRDALRREERQQAPVMDWDNIIFVCHSTGGIVVRYMLDRWSSEFADKNLGLVLIASPSYGSDLADLVALVSDVYAQKMSKQLRWGNESLTDLDDRFKSLIDEKRIKHLTGVEAIENRFIVHFKWLWLFNKTRVVDKEAAARYFAEPRTLRDTNHFTTVKPGDRKHPGYELLLDFYTHKYRPMVGAS